MPATVLNSLRSDPKRSNGIGAGFRGRPGQPERRVRSIADCNIRDASNFMQCRRRSDGL